jgi:hypothetical protein
MIAGEEKRTLYLLDRLMVFSIPPFRKVDIFMFWVVWLYLDWFLVTSGSAVVT